MVRLHEAGSQPNIVAIVEARMTSSRLPGKHLFEVCGKSMLQHLVERLNKVPLINAIVLATPKGKSHDPLIDLADHLEIAHYQGSEDNVMERVLEAAKQYSADIICEVLGDCPIIDPELVQQLIKTFLSNQVVYASNSEHGLPDGMGAQVFYLSALEESYRMTNDLLDLEHVTLHIRKNKEMFSSLYLAAPDSLCWPQLGVTLDEESDYLLLKKIIECLYPTDHFFGCHDVIRTLIENPDWLSINEHVQRKGAT